jgi:hypothetical protein
MAQHMTFIQTIEFSTTRISEIEDLMDEWLTKSGGRRTTGRATLVADHDRPTVYRNLDVQRVGDMSRTGREK